MKKEFSKYFTASLIRTAKNVQPLVGKKNKYEAKIKELEEQINELQEQIDSWQIPIKDITGGYTTEDLVERSIVETDKVDSKGNTIKQTIYSLKYPDTVIPPKPAGSDFDIDNNNNF